MRWKITPDSLGIRGMSDKAAKRRAEILAQFTGHRLQQRLRLPDDGGRAVSDGVRR